MASAYRSIPGSNILVFGVSGVGKSTSCKEFVRQHPEFMYFSAGQLLQEALARDPECLRSLAPSSIIANQLLLGSLFQAARSVQTERPALIDAHAIIFNGVEIVEVPTEAIQRFLPTQLILLEASPATIARRRAFDQRSRPLRSETELADEAVKERRAVERFSRELATPMKIGSTETAGALEQIICG